MTAMPPEPRSRMDSYIFWYLGVSTMALVALIVIVIILLVGNDRVTAAQQHANITQCQLANVSRQQDVAIWNRLLAIPPAARKAETAAQRAEVADLERLVAVKDTPRDCNAAFSTGK